MLYLFVWVGKKRENIGEKTWLEAEADFLGEVFASTKKLKIPSVFVPMKILHRLLKWDENLNHPKRSNQNQGTTFLLTHQVKNLWKILSKLLIVLPKIEDPKELEIIGSGGEKNKKEREREINKINFLFINSYFGSMVMVSYLRVLLFPSNMSLGC